MPTDNTVLEIFYFAKDICLSKMSRSFEMFIAEHLGPDGEALQDIGLVTGLII